MRRFVRTAFCLLELYDILKIHKECERMQYREFGKTGAAISALGFGCMRFPTLADGAIDEAKAIRMLRRAIDGGVNYIDTAYMYHNYQSEALVGKALRDGYREKVYLTTKSPVFEMTKSEDFERILAEQLQKLQTDHVDFYLLHSLDREAWEEKVLPWHLLDKMVKAKQDGKIRHIGFSFHDDYDAFRTIVDGFDQWEFCQVQMNYADVDHQATMAGIEYAHAKGLGVIIMEPLLGGKLANPTERVASCFKADKTPVEWALDFLWDRKEISFLLSGMSTMEQVEQNLEYASRARVGMLKEEERACYEKAREIFWNSAKVGCTKCRYCMPCPFGLQIPETFEVYNQTALPHRTKTAQAAYDALPMKADQCRKCGHCESVCPQHLPIPMLMEQIDRYFQK